MKKQNVMKTFLYRETFPSLIDKGKHTIPSNGNFEYTIESAESLQNSRIVDIFWEASEINAISISEKDNESIPYDSVKICFYNNSNSTIDIRLYTIEEFETGIIEVEGESS
ncbi:hypothetical protein COC69_23370 [Bacillus cereus]|uniref:Uncharacterized protein n=1 Tax=Bacillus cereus TaxID=1396 RepID=A0A9X7CJK4_BACCE|nr:hypothetical protein [Bacillus cereus]PGS74163.1 hypothetical protein COC69_23370 [Bacillus cereus]